MKFLIYFFIYLFLEIIFSYRFTSIFGTIGMFLEVIATIIIGISIIQNFNITFLENFKKLFHREIDENEFISIGMFKFIGAILIILPGIFTDIIGILMQFEPLIIAISNKIFKQNRNYYSNSQYNNDIIDVEIIEDKNVK